MNLETPQDLLKTTLVRSKKRYLPYKTTLDFKCLPYEETEYEIFLAYALDYPFEAIAVLAAMTEKNVIAVNVEESELLKAIELCYEATDSDTLALIQEAHKSPTHKQSVFDEGHDLLSEIETSPVIRIVNAIFLEAIKMGASDIHFEPSEKGLVVRYRVDGVLIMKHNPPKDIETQIIARVKVLAQLDIAETRLPQDGRLKLKMNQRSIDFRVSVIPVAYGERIVLRVLDKSHLSLSLEKLGIPPDILQALMEALYVPEGMLLVTGPTGSGKTTTLYSALYKLLKDPINIMTIEDPVEYRFSGMAQISVNPKIQLNFASGLKHILRQDPDVIMIGEIRDFETAEIATQASLTGHRVFSTLHTNDAPSAITRLVDMGIEPYLLCSSLTGVLAQRLVRKICPSCKIKISMPLNFKSRFPLVDHDIFYKGSGCDECFYTGYRGRIGIYEFLTINSHLKKFILKVQDAESLKEEALATGFRDLQYQALELAKLGITTLEEVLSVTKSFRA
jgi:general secretion pathway protein E